jgi:two-component system CheB/CheR fusion protein
MGSACNDLTAVARPLRILVVEDYADAAGSMEMLLRIWGHEVRSVPDGPSALGAARSDPPDVVLLDLGLPGGMDGWQVAKVLQLQPALKRPFLIAVTGFGQDADRRRSREAGIDLHLVKPVEPDQLRGLLCRFQQLLYQPADQTPLPLRVRVRLAGRPLPRHP